MVALMFMYAGSVLPFAWGIGHLFPTNAVVRDFGAISDDNRRTITKEWMNEGVTLIFLGVLVALVTFIDPFSAVAKAVYWSACIFLNVLSLISLFTGYRNSFIAFKLCPFIFTGSSVLIIAGSSLR